MATDRVGLPRGFPQTRIASWAATLPGQSPARTVLLAAVVALALVIAATTFLIFELRAREIKDARRGLSNINAVLAEATSRALQSVDLLLTALVEDMKSSGIASVEDVKRLRTDRAAHDGLRARVAGLPQLDGLSIVDLDGQLVSFSRSFPPAEIALADREHFQRLRSGEAAEPFLSEPVQNRGTGEWTFYLARRIRGPAGEAIGFAYGAIALDYFLGLYSSLDIGRDSSVALWRLDGTLLARRPAVPDGVGRRFETPAFQGVTPTSPPLIYETPRAIDGHSRLVARRVVPDFPVAIVTTLNMRDVLGPWRRQSVVLAGFGALLTAAIVTLATALRRQLTAYEEVERATEETTSAVRGLQEIEAQLRQSQKLEVMGQMTSSVAHDFNNLLTIVLGNLERIAKQLPEGADGLRRNVEAARGGAERAASLTQRLLAFSRRQPLEPKSLDVNAMIGGIDDMLRQTLGQNMALRLDLEPRLAPVFADPTGLESALLNLVVNARDAMPGGGTVTIETRQAEPPPGTEPAIPHLAITVVDTGIGMSPDVAQRALEPFFTTKEPGVGTGLGLAQVYGFTRQTGGEVSIESTEGVGTRIRLLLPCSDPEGALAG